MKRFLPLLFLPLLGASPQATRPAPNSARLLTLRVNGQAVATDTVSSRFFLEEDKVLRLNIVRADDPDGEGLTIIIDRFPIQTGTYSFQEILSGRNRDASYRFGSVAAYSKSCPNNPGAVTITGVDAARHWLMGTYRCQVCKSGPRGQRLTLEGTFRYPVEK